MFCSKCGKENPDNAIYCKNCGVRLNKSDENAPKKKSVTEIKDKVEGPKKSWYSWYMWWQVDEKEIREQVDNYDSLKITASYKGRAVLWLLVSIIITVIATIFWGLMDIENLLFALFIYSPIAFFVYRGHRWAIMAAMVLWTIDRFAALLVYESSIPISIIWWFLVMDPLYKAFRVEQMRKILNK